MKRIRCFIVLLLFVGLLYWGYRATIDPNEIEGKYIQKAESKYKNELDQKYAEFRQSNISELTRVIDSLTELEAHYADKLTALENELGKLGRSAENDEDWKAWNKEKDKLGKAKASFVRSSEQAFIAYLKYEMAPSDELKTRMLSVIQDANNNAEREIGRYDELLKNVGI